MVWLNVEVILLDSEMMNGIFVEIECKYVHQLMMLKVIDEM